MNTNEPKTEVPELSKEVVDSIYQKIVDKVHNMSDSDVAEDLTQVAETFDALEAEGVDIPPVNTPSAEAYNQKLIQEQFAKYMKLRENHIPGKTFTMSDGVVFEVQDRPHEGMWVRKEKRKCINPNMNNKSVHRKLKKNPTKYDVVNQ